MIRLRPSCLSLLLATSCCAPTATFPAAPFPLSPPASGAVDPVRLPAVGETARIDEELVVRRVGRDAFEVTEEPFFSSNILVVRMPDGTVVVCSSPFETEGARALIRWVKAALAPRRMVAINTHFHLDGTGGNEAYRELGVTTYASDHTQRLLAEKGGALQEDVVRGLDDPGQRRRVEKTRLVPAERTFPEREGLALTFGGEEVRAIYPGAAHSPDNVLVFFPAQKILFGGCMVKTSTAIGYTGDADLDHWSKALDVARTLGAITVIPGHGEGTGTELFDVTAKAVSRAVGARGR